MKKLTKPKLRKLFYIFIIGGLGLAGIVLFSVSQYEKAKFASSSVVLTDAESQIKILESSTQDEATLDKLAWYKDIAEHFRIVNENNANLYKGTAIPSYALVTLALVSFGLCLKFEDRAKEKEEDSD